MKLFYSTSLLSIKNKTPLALIFYISTTDNKYKRISKKDIDGVNIKATILTLKNPPQQFALRLYATLIKGIVKIFAYKIKYCETDIVTFYRTMCEKKVTRELKTPRKLNFKLNTVPVKLENITELEPCQFENIFANDTISSLISAENTILNDTFVNNFTVNEDFIRISPEKDNREYQKIIDDSITLTDDNKIKKRRIMAKPIVLKNDMISCYILDAVKLLFAKKNEDNLSVEEIRKEQSIISTVHASSSTLFPSLINPPDFQDFDDVDCNTGFELEYCDSCFNFNQVVSVLSKFDKSIGFLKILEGITNGVLYANQTEPYGIIIVNKYEN